MKIKSRIYLFILAALLVFITGCDAGGEESTKSYMLSPPSWVIGDWETTTGALGFTITEHNVVMSMSGIEATDFTFVYEGDMADFLTEDVNSDTEYTFTASFSEYKFEKTSNTSLDMSMGGQTAFIMTKQD